MAYITCKDLTLGYEGHAIVSDLNFKVSKGDYLCIVGENGTGKSTLIKTLLHLQDVISGDIITGDGLKAYEVGYLPQQTVVQKDFPATVEEIVLSGTLAKCGWRPFYRKAEKKLAEEKMKRMEQLLAREKMVAVGEIGLDYYWPEPDHGTQKKWFLRQLDLAREIKKPVIIHSRDAAKDTVDLMTEAHAEEIGGVIHCYSYTKETAKIFLDMGFYFGIGGVLTFKNAKKLKEAVEYIPMDRIVLETDCPYLAPEPNRGKRNSSLNIPYVIAVMAQIKGITEEEVRKAAWDNSLKLYHMER